MKKVPRDTRTTSGAAPPERNFPSINTSQKVNPCAFTVLCSRVEVRKKSGSERVKIHAFFKNGIPVGILLQVPLGMIQFKIWQYNQSLVKHGVVMLDVTNAGMNDPGIKLTKPRSFRMPWNELEEKTWLINFGAYTGAIKN